MKKILIVVAGLGLVSGVWAQPKPKSQKEAEALMAVQTAADPDAQLAAIENVLTKFADTQYKPMLLGMAVQVSQQKGDAEKLAIYAERALKEDPKSYAVMLILAQAIAQKTREFDLDREEKLKQAEALANEGIALSKAAAKPRPDITDEQWANAKKDLEAQGYESLGIAALVRKKYDDAIVQFKKAVEAQGTPEPATKVRLAAAQNAAGDFDSAMVVLDEVLKDPQLHAAIRQVAGQEKLKATQGKAAKK